jgi:predicted small secreted protein
MNRTRKKDNPRWAWLNVLWAVLLMPAFLLLGPSGCNTAEGFGEDLESAGEGLQDEARDEDEDWDDEDDWDDD